MSKKFIFTLVISITVILSFVITGILSIKSLTVKVTDKEEICQALSGNTSGKCEEINHFSQKEVRTEVHFVTFLDISRGEVIKCQVPEMVFKELKKGTKIKVASLWCPLVLAGDQVK